jgi:broad specificity phosphatase PhoE
VRAVQTTLAGFSHILSKQDVNGGKDQGSRLIIDPDLQERSDLPCDTGSEKSRLDIAFPALDFSVLSDAWFAKEGIYAADDAAVAARAKRFRERLREKVENLQRSEDFVEGRKNIVVVTHGVFMKFLSEDMTIDLPKAGWKAFTIANGANGEAVLDPVE